MFGGFRSEQSFPSAALARSDDAGRYPSAQLTDSQPICRYTELRAMFSGAFWREGERGMSQVAVRGGGVFVRRAVANVGLLLSGAICLAFIVLAANPSIAAVIVFANRTAEPVEFALVAVRPDPNAAAADMPWKPFGRVQEYTIRPTSTLPVPVLGNVQVEFDEGADARQYLLDPDTVCYFIQPDGGLDLQQIGFRDQETLAATAGGEPPDGPAECYEAREKRFREIAMTATAVIPVKMLVDEQELRTTEVWQQKLRARLNAASNILEYHCRVRFEIVAFDTWHSDNSINEFALSLREFERDAVPAPAQLAIGFTSQYKPPDGPTRLGGTRGPFRTHLLIREWPRHATEAERLEVLVHELGHYLGATHSPEADSVMRPRLADGLARRRDFPIHFDPVNALLLYLVGEQIRTANVQSFADLNPSTKSQLRRIYAETTRAFPEDTAARQLTSFLGAFDPRAADREQRQARLSSAAAVVVQAVVETAAEHHSSGDAPAQSDTLAERYIRVAAAQAEDLPPDIQAKAFLLGIAVALDDQRLLRDHRATGQLVQSVESEEQRARRLSLLGKPTALGRGDLLLHFVYSAGLAAVVSPTAAETAGVLKEMSDSRGTSGFSFADYAADLAGIEMARRVMQGELALSTLADNFRLPGLVPPIDDLPEGLTEEQFIAQFGSPSDDRFLALRKSIVERIKALELMPGTPMPAAQ